jgi:hypothetical protein
MDVHILADKDKVGHCQNAEPRLPAKASMRFSFEPTEGSAHRDPSAS